MISFSQLESDRKKWVPYPMQKEEHNISESSTNVEQVLERALCLGLYLELPVAEWVTEASKTLKHLPGDARLTLARNIGDEGVHFKGFEYAQEAGYISNRDSLIEADAIAKEWQLDSSLPLLTGCIAETGVFIPSLMALRLWGSKDVANLAGNVSRDEYRHIATNRSVLAMIGVNLHASSPSLDKLRLKTLDWVFQGFTDSEICIDLDWIIEQSNLLLENGYAPELEDIADHADYVPPFERSNYLQY